MPAKHWRLCNVVAAKVCRICMRLAASRRPFLCRFAANLNEILTRVADSRVHTVPNFILFCMRPAATLVQIAWD
jgi:hypothetical protein